MFSMQNRPFRLRGAQHGMKISILLPNFNHAALITQTFEGLLARAIKTGNSALSMMARPMRVGQSSSAIATGMRAPIKKLQARKTLAKCETREAVIVLAVAVRNAPSKLGEGLSRGGKHHERSFADSCGTVGLRDRLLFSLVDAVNGILVGTVTGGSASRRRT